MICQVSSLQASGYADNETQVLFISDQNICQMDHFAQDLLRALSPVPEAPAIIQIKTDGDASRTSVTHRVDSQISGRCADRRRNACGVKPDGSFKNAIP